MPDHVAGTAFHIGSFHVTVKQEVILFVFRIKNVFAVADFGNRAVVVHHNFKGTGDDTDRLGAFKAAAALQHTTPERALAGMLAKHIVSLYDMCFDNDTDYGISTWEEKITDSLNYLFLLKAIVKEGHTDQTD